MKSKVRRDEKKEKERDVRIEEREGEAGGEWDVGWGGTNMGEPG